MRKVLIGAAIAVIGVVASASAASAAPASFISFGGRVVAAPITTPATSGVISTESPDKILAGDPSGFNTTTFGQNIDTTVSVGQIVTTTTK
jgi:hypothetical protein